MRSAIHPTLQSLAPVAPHLLHILTYLTIAYTKNFTNHPVLSTWTWITLFIGYRSHKWQFHLHPWTTSLIHAILTSTLSTSAFIIDNATLSSPSTYPYAKIVSTLQYLSILNLSAYIASDLFNKLSPIFVFHHILTLLATLLALFHICEPALVAYMALAEWTVPCLYMVKYNVATPYNYICLFVCHVIFRIYVPWLGLASLITPYLQAHVAWRVVYYMYMGLQLWWLFTMVYTGWRMRTLKRTLHIRELEDPQTE